MMKKPLLMAALKYGLGVVLLTWVIWWNWERLAEAFRRPVQLTQLASACGFLIGGMLLGFVRWYVLARAQGLPFTLSAAIRLGLAGFFFNTFLPGAVGGDIVKAAFIAREQRRRTVAIATVLIDRVIGLWGLCWLVTATGVAFWTTGVLSAEGAEQVRWIVAIAAVLVIVPLVAWSALGSLTAERAERVAERLARLPRLGRQAVEFWRAVLLYRRHNWSFWLALLLTVVSQAGWVLMFYFCALTLLAPGQAPSVGVHFLIIPIGMIVQALPLTPGGVGIGEAVFGGLYQLVGYAAGAGVLAALVQRVALWGVSFLGYIVYLGMRPSLARAPARAESESAAA
jgi:uncharacterized protein (TIRG00374 family)